MSHSAWCTCAKSFSPEVLQPQDNKYWVSFFAWQCSWHCSKVRDAQVPNHCPKRPEERQHSANSCLSRYFLVIMQIIYTDTQPYMNKHAHITYTHIGCQWISVTDPIQSYHERIAMHALSHLTREAGFGCPCKQSKTQDPTRSMPRSTYVRACGYVLQSSYQRVCVCARARGYVGNILTQTSTHSHLGVMILSRASSRNTGSKSKTFLDRSRRSRLQLLRIVASTTRFPFILTLDMAGMKSLVE